jgi:recombination protein RecA
VRLVEAKAFAIVVLDACAGIGNSAHTDSQVNLAKWPNIVRRLNVALGGTQSIVLLLTDQSSYRPLPLPVGMRLEFSCPERGSLKLQVAKEKHGRISAPRTIRSF